MAGTLSGDRAARKGRRQSRKHVAASCRPRPTSETSPIARFPESKSRISRTLGSGPSRVDHRSKSEPNRRRPPDSAQGFGQPTRDRGDGPATSPKNSIASTLPPEWGVNNSTAGASRGERPSRAAGHRKCRGDGTNRSNCGDARRGSPPDEPSRGQDSPIAECPPRAGGGRTFGAAVDGDGVSTNTPSTNLTRSWRRARLGNRHTPEPQSSLNSADVVSRREFLAC